jgi:hypothetical protein
MAKSTILHTGCASRWALGESLRRRCCLAPLRAQGTVPQKPVRYRPIDKGLDALLGLLCGAQTIAPSPVTMRTDPAVQRAFGRTGCADQSPIARTRRACTPDNVAPLARVSWYSRKRYGATPHHRCTERRLGVEVESTPMPIGAKAAGSERTWRGRHRSQTGRKTWRITASEDRAILYATLVRGKAPAGPALTTALQEVERRLGWTRQRRSRMVRRLDGGFGTTVGLHWRRSRGSQVVAQIRHSGRGRK